MKKEIWLVIILGIVFIILLGVLIWLPAKKAPKPIINGIEIISPKANKEVFSPIKITGVVNRNGWGGFEGQVGTVKLLDSTGKQLGQTAILSATTSWMQSQISFEANLNFISTEAQNGTLVFYNENPSGLPDKDKTFILPVKIK